MLLTTSPRIFVVTTIDGFASADALAPLSYSIDLLSLQAVNASERTAATAVVDNSIFFMELRNISDLL